MIVLQAIHARPRQTCTIEGLSIYEAQRNHLGGQSNLHFPILFGDGVRWLLRVRISDDNIPTDAQRLVTESEVTTMKTLLSTGLPVPNAWVPNRELYPIKSEPWSSSSGDGLTDSDNDLDYLFIEFMQGSYHDLTRKTRQKFIVDYATHKVQSLKADFDSSGSLLPAVKENESGDTYVGPFISLHAFNRPDPPYWYGPFISVRERYLTQIDYHLEHFDDLHGSQSEFFLALLWVRELVANCEEMKAKKGERFYLMHPDDNGSQNLTVDGKITAMLDWQW
jgi:hypothetical protein